VNPTVRDAQTPSTAQARTVAGWLIEEAAAHRLDPIESCEPRFESVHLRVRPSDTAVWRTWCNLLHAERIQLRTGDDTATARGHWDGVRVMLIGEGASTWTTP
jgi:hypothetical protein